MSDNVKANDLPDYSPGDPKLTAEVVGSSNLIASKLDQAGSSSKIDSHLSIPADAAVRISEGSNLNNVTTEDSEKALIASAEGIMETLGEKDDIPTYSSDDLGSGSDDSETEASSASSTDDSSSDSDSRDQSSEEEEEDVVRHQGNEEDDLEEGEEGPIRSKNEILDETAPSLPEGFKIDDKAPLELIGEIISAVEKSVIIKANISGEFRILKENSILCFENREVLGPLFEVFGRLQAPFYRVKFNSESDLSKYKAKIGSLVYYVVPDSQFVYTDSIKAIKGTDASNWNDEELPEDEQEFSDDEKEAASKSKRKKGKKKSMKAPIIANKRPATGTGEEQPKKISNYQPKYSSYKSVNDMGEMVQQKDEDSPVIQQSSPETPQQPNPEEQMLKLQQQFLQIHNNNSKTKHTNNAEIDGTNKTYQHMPTPDFNYQQQQVFQQYYNTQPQNYQNYTNYNQPIHQYPQQQHPGYQHPHPPAYNLQYLQPQTYQQQINFQQQNFAQQLLPQFQAPLAGPALSHQNPQQNQYPTFQTTHATAVAQAQAQQQHVYSEHHNTQGHEKSSKGNEKEAEDEFDY